jgi:hypothetical protein
MEFALAAFFMRMFFQFSKSVFLQINLDTWQAYNQFMDNSPLFKFQAALFICSIIPLFYGFVIVYRMVVWCVKTFFKKVDTNELSV